MSSPDSKIVDLRQRRAQEEQRRRAVAEAARAAERRRRLAEHGPASGRVGRWVGLAGSALIWIVIAAALVVVAWKHLH